MLVNFSSPPTTRALEKTLLRHLQYFNCQTQLFSVCWSVVRPWFLIFLTTHVATCGLTLPPPESLRGARSVVMGASTDIGEQLAYHHTRLGAQIVITTRREYMHCTRSVLLRMCLMQFVTCCALPFTHPSLFLTIFFPRETICLSCWQQFLLFRHNNYSQVS